MLYSCRYRDSNIMTTQVWQCVHVIKNSNIHNATVICQYTQMKICLLVIMQVHENPCHP